MSESYPNQYPENLPDLAALEMGAATALTLGTLLDLAEEFAVNGGREHHENVPLGFQNELLIGKGRTVYTVRYFSEDGSEVELGKKALDILIKDVRSEDEAQQAAQKKTYDYTNIYFVYGGLDQADAPKYCVEKRQFSCGSSELMPIVLANHLDDSPEYLIEKALSMNELKEAEALYVARHLLEKLTEEPRAA